MANSTSLFAQILHMIPRTSFERHVRETKAARHSKGFSCWDQCVAMLFCQLAQAGSLREIQDGLRVTHGKLNHLGLAQAPAVSTLAYANAHRPAALYERIFFDLVARCSQPQRGKKRRFRFKNKLLSLDGTMIELCLSLFPWAQYTTRKGAAKVHVLLDHAGYLPCFAVIGPAKTLSEIAVAKQLALPKGSIIAVDRGYCSFDLFHQWTQQGVFFVTRMKRNTAYRVVEERSVPVRGGIRADQSIEFTSADGQAQAPGRYRRIVLWDADKQEEIVFLTNHLTFGPTTIARIYKDRWEIELFFKALKQNLKIKTFVGTTLNALQIQIWTALIAMLLLKYLQFIATGELSLSRLIALLRLSLFTYRNLWEWLENPFVTSDDPSPGQLALAI